MSEFSAFHNVQFPAAISFGATGGPEWRNEIVGLTSGREKRNARQSVSRRRYDAGTGVRSLADIEAVMSFFEARRGSLHAFRFRDPFDAKSGVGEPGPGDQMLGAGDGVTTRFALVKTYGSGADAFLRPIRLPVTGSLRVAVSGVELGPGAFSFDGDAGEVALGSAPATGAMITAGFTFDVPVRFDIEHLSVSLTAFRAGQIPSIPLLEVLL